MFACKCLNIIIRSGSSRLRDVDASVKENLGTDSLKENVGVVDFDELVYKLPNLIEEKQENAWTKYRCKNCGLWAYALSKELGDSRAIINKDMLTDASKIESVQRDESYSPVFDVLINRNYRDLPSAKYELLHPIAINWLKAKTEQTEERIRKFMDSQYEELDQLRIRAHQDQRALSRVMSCDKIDSNFSPEKYSQPSSPSKKIEKTIGDSGKNREKDVFNFEYDYDANDKVEDSGKSEESDVGEAPDEDLISERNRPTEASIARSLPIPVPQFLEERNPNKVNRSPQTPSDIAASIKALAKSIHEEGIFGELPRPRFTTNL